MKLIDILSFCFEQNYGLDRSNAAIHTAVVRFSPITFRLAEEITAQRNAYGFALLGVTAAAVAEVMSHNGSYTEDVGR